MKGNNSSTGEKGPSRWRGPLSAVAAMTPCTPCTLFCGTDRAFSHESLLCMF